MIEFAELGNAATDYRGALVYYATEVAELEAKLKESTRLLGKAVFHLRDMASPTVVRLCEDIHTIRALN